MHIGILPPAKNSLYLALSLVCGMFQIAYGGDTNTTAQSSRHIAEETHMGIPIRITAYVPQNINPAIVLRQVFNRIGELAWMLSDYDPTSELRELEENAWKGPQPASKELIDILNHSLRLAQQSSGAFDPTFGSVTRLWRRSHNTQRAIDETEWEQALQRTGWRKVHLDLERRTVFLQQQGVQFDLGGIAKGFIADQALAVLKHKGVRQAQIEIAGDIVAGDPPPGQEGWNVAVDAAGERGTIERQVLLDNQAISTSSDRERFFVSQGKTCSHILNPVLGPCSQTHAVSVITDSGITADGLATALAILGPAASTTLLKHDPDTTVYWATDEK